MAVRGFHNLVKIEADAKGNAPQTIEVLRIGNWHTPWHGDFEITTEDIAQFVNNADSGTGLVASDPRVPVNYGHASYDKAAGWSTRVYASDDGEALLMDVDWTTAAVEAIAAGEWKYISPEFNPRSWPWEDPEEEHHFVNNVLTGAALTNIPLFKKLKPITASRVPNKKASSAAGNDDKSKGEIMTLEEIRAKALADLTDEEKTFLVENKAELTAEELKKFELEEEAPAETPETPEAPETPEVPETAEGGAPVEASAITGITDEEIAQLRADAQAGIAARKQLAEKEAQEFVKASITAGRVKSDQLDNTVKMLLASKGDDRTQLEAFINALPVNPILASEQGHAAPEVVAPEVTAAEKEIAEGFGNSEEEIAAFKKSQEESK